MPKRHFLRHFVENRPPKKCRFGIFYDSGDDRVKRVKISNGDTIHLFTKLNKLLYNSQCTSKNENSVTNTFYILLGFMKL